LVRGAEKNTHRRDAGRAKSIEITDALSIVITAAASERSRLVPTRLKWFQESKTYGEEEKNAPA
jgi:hypothetical protein